MLSNKHENIQLEHKVIYSAPTFRTRSFHAHEKWQHEYLAMLRCGMKAERALKWTKNHVLGLELQQARTSRFCR